VLQTLRPNPRPVTISSSSSGLASDDRSDVVHAGVPAAAAVAMPSPAAVLAGSEVGVACNQGMIGA
jgi:hypothetical protein